MHIGVLYRGKVKPLGTKAICTHSPSFVQGVKIEEAFLFPKQHVFYWNGWNKAYLKTFFFQDKLNSNEVVQMVAMMSFCPCPPSLVATSVFWLYTAIEVSKEKWQRQDSGQELLGTTGNVLQETENEETKKSRKALKETWPNQRALFKIAHSFSVRDAL